MDLLEITNKGNRHPWETARKNIVTSFISNLQKSNFEILDVGSGDAYLADSFTKSFRNCHSFCVDSGYTTNLIFNIENGFKNNNLKLYSSLNDVEASKIDIVTLMDVLEHVPDDVDFLNEIISQPYINNDTLIIISVPAYQTLFSQHDKILKHYRRYNLQKLKLTAEKCNLKFLDAGYFFFILIIPRLIQIIIEKASLQKNRKKDNLGTWRGGKFITNIIKNVLLVDYKVGRILKLMGINLPGLSCYMICKIK